MPNEIALAREQIINKVVGWVLRWCEYYGESGLSAEERKRLKNHMSRKAIKHSTRAGYCIDITTIYNYCHDLILRKVVTVESEEKDWREDFAEGYESFLRAHLGIYPYYGHEAENNFICSLGKFINEKDVIDSGSEIPEFTKH